MIWQPQVLFKMRYKRDSGWGTGVAETADNQKVKTVLPFPLGGVCTGHFPTASMT